MQPESCRIVYAGSDFLHPVWFSSCIQFGPILPKKAQIISCKTGPYLIWMAWSGFGQMHLIWKQASVQELSGLVLAERHQPATSFKTLLVSSTDGPYHTVQNQPGFDLVLADCQVLTKWMMDPVQKKPVCKNNWACFWSVLLSQSGSDANQIWHVSGNVLVYSMLPWHGTVHSVLLHTASMIIAGVGA